MLGIKTWLKWYYFDHIRVPLNVRRIRHKKQIRVLFILTEISIWKSESLYQKMLEHPRFVPILGITPTYVDDEEARGRIRAYCKEKNYNHINISVEQTLVEQSQADIVLYSEPYQSNYWPNHRFTNNKSALFVYVPYAMHSVLEDWNINDFFYLHVWQYYFENQLTAQEFSDRMKNHGRNIIVTGLPIMDQLMDMGKEEGNPWQNITSKKRIIYAPHHTIGCAKNPNLKGIDYSTFLQYSDFMLEMARKYKNEIHIAFKPHPYLKNKLYLEWGKEKTDAYYHKWEEMENTQYECGKYMSLFHHSDAMIHDCGSFTVEYLYTRKPVMYLESNGYHDSNISQFMKESYYLHEHGHDKQQIEDFIVGVIHGVDKRKNERERFYKENLCPVDGNSACHNIIEAILNP